MAKFTPIPDPIQNPDGTLSIPLTQGMFAIIDADDWSIVSQYKWHAHKVRNTFYAYTHERGNRKNRRFIAMHQLIMNTPAGAKVDHVNGNGLDNRSKNLRLATTSQNGQNARGRVGTSKFKGVSWTTRESKWRARIKYNGKHHYLGSFTSEEAAAHAYDEKARELFGRFAWLNYPDDAV